MAPKDEVVTVEGHPVRFTHPDKVVCPATGTTKQDVMSYYLRIAPWLAPQSAWRPATRKRWVGGVGTEDKPGKVFFRKDLEAGAPKWLPIGRVEHRNKVNTYPLVNNAAVLAWFTQVGALEIHVPQWRFDAAGNPCNPDRIVIDLDPGPGAGLADCAEVAFEVRDLLAARGLATYPVTSGSKGIHLYAPLSGATTGEEANVLAHETALTLEEARPHQVVSVQRKSDREGKVLLDWSQNSPAKTTVCPYSLRGKVLPTVAAPRTWEEIAEPGLSQLTYEQVLERAEGGLNPIANLGWDRAEPPLSPENWY